jgi:hypothetical protein
MAAMEESPAQRLVLEAAGTDCLRASPAAEPDGRRRYWVLGPGDERPRGVRHATVSALLNARLLYLPERWVTAPGLSIPVRLTRAGTVHLHRPYRCPQRNQDGTRCKNRVATETARCSNHRAATS